MTIRTELQESCNESRPLRKSASLTAHNVTRNTGAIASAGSAQPDGITFGNDVECGSFLVVDQHTFEGEIHSLIQTAQRRAALRSAAQCSTVQYSTIQYYTVLYCTRH